MTTTLAFSLVAAAAFAGMPAAASAQAALGANSTPVSAPNPTNAKAPGTLRIGVAPSQAQVGQGSNAQGDFGTPIRNSIVVLMSGPAVEIIPLDAHLAVQLQVEAQQKQCDFILYSSVTVKRSEGGGFGKFVKKAAPVAGMLPMAGMAGGMGGAVAGQVAGVAVVAAAQTAQQQAMSQLASFNGQIKSKDDVSVGYQLLEPGQDKPRLQSTLNGKAKNDGEDVLTPLLLKAADTILTEVTKK